MTLVQLREFLLSQPSATGTPPSARRSWSPHRRQDVCPGGLAGGALSINLKCRTQARPAAAGDPPRGETGLAHEQAALEHGDPGEGLSDDLWQGWIVHSYERVVAGLPRAKRPQAPARPSGRADPCRLLLLLASSPRGGAHTKAAGSVRAVGTPPGACTPQPGACGAVGQGRPSPGACQPVTRAPWLGHRARRCAPWLCHPER